MCSFKDTRKFFCGFLYNAGLVDRIRAIHFVFCLHNIMCIITLDFVFTASVQISITSTSIVSVALEKLMMHTPYCNYGDPWPNG